MKIIRQKIFFLPALGTALNVVGTVGTVAGLKQGADQQKQQEELAEQQKERDMQTVKALNNIAKQAAKNPETAQAAANIMSQAQEQKQYSIGSIFKGIKTAGKEVKSLGKNVGKIVLKDSPILAGGVMAGGAMAGSSYLADKIIQADMKKSGIELPNIESQKNYSNLSSLKPYLKNTKDFLNKSYRKNKSMVFTTAVLGAAPPLLSYASQKQAIKDQISNTTTPSHYEEGYQKNYSIMSGFNGMKRSFQKNWKNFNNHKTESILGGISNLFGGGGRYGVKGFGTKLRNLGRKDGSKLTENVGQFIIDHPKTSLVASMPVGLGVMAATWDQGDKIVNKTLRKVDKNAYKYQDFNNQEIQA